MRSLLQGLAGLVLPAICAACRRLSDGESPFCAACLVSLEPIVRGCPRCGLPAPVERTAPTREAAPCLGCQRAPPVWGSAVAPLIYGGALAVAVRRWKLGPAPELSRPLARLLAPSLSRLAGVDALVPVPLHRRRLAAREFNQAAELARRTCAPRRDGPAFADLLARTRDTPSQSRLDVKERRKNVRGAFTLRGRDDVHGAHLCLVDDVLTTGATATACAQVLLDGGAARVDVLTLARAVT